MIEGKQLNLKIYFSSAKDYCHCAVLLQKSSHHTMGMKLLKKHISGKKEDSGCWKHWQNLNTSVSIRLFLH